MASPMTLAKINKLFVAHRRKQRSSPYLVSHINRGDCYRWAYVVHKIFGAELCNLRKITTMPVVGQLAGYRRRVISRHAIVKMHGKYYDAECLRGIVDWRLMPAVKGYEAELKMMSPEKFCKSWHFEDSDIEWEMKEMGIAV